MNDSIVKLMAPGTDHDLDWLKKALQSAIELEWFTIPPYLCAYWSVKNRKDYTALSLRSVWKDEMSHFGNACNLLAALGRDPALKDAIGNETYPGPLPGGVRPDLNVSLSGLTTAQAQTFMDIEMPAWPPVAHLLGDDYKTIGDFYDAIKVAFVKCVKPGDLKTDRQLTYPGMMDKITSLADVENVIDLICHQGEGYDDSSPYVSLGGPPAHYYRFGEIFHGQKIRTDPVTGKFEFKGAPLPPLDPWPMAPVPLGGYQKADVKDNNAWTLLSDFDAKYTALLKALENAWKNPSPNGLDDAVDAMSELTDPAISLMQIEIAPGLGNYGPCFRLA